MASATQPEKVAESVQEEKTSPSIQMSSIARIMNFPLVKRTAEVVTAAYTKIKDNNAVTKRTLTSAESIVKNAIDTTTPLVATLQKPIEKVDNLLCSGLDYVEQKIPAIKSEPGQMSDIVQYISEIRPVKTLLSIPEYGKRRVMNSFVVTRVQQAISQLKPYFNLKAYQQNFDIYDYIAKKLYDFFPSAGEEVTDTEKSDETASSKNQPKPSLEHQKRKLQPIPEGTTETQDIQNGS